MRKNAGVLLAALITILLGGCLADPGEKTLPEAARQPLTVAAASSMQYAFQEIAAQYTKQTGQPVVFTFGSTGSLATQVAQGAPVDLLAAADVKSIRDLRDKGLIIPDTEQVYAVGELVLAYRRGAGAGASAGLPETDLNSLLDPAVVRVAMANPEHAPYGMAARQALVAAGLWSSLQPKLVYGENVSQALQFVQTGNAEVGFVALSVARVPGVAYRPVPDQLYEPIQQSLAVIRGTARERAARDLINFINSQRGRGILQAYGFSFAG